MEFGCSWVTNKIAHKDKSKFVRALTSNLRLSYITVLFKFKVPISSHDIIYVNGAICDLRTLMYCGFVFCHGALRLFKNSEWVYLVAISKVTKQVPVVKMNGSRWAKRVRLIDNNS